MKDIDLGKYRSAWKRERSFNEKVLSENEIKKYLKKRSSDITRSFKTGLVIDIVLKILLVISFILIPWLISNNTGIIVLCTVLSVIIIILILFQILIYRLIPKHSDYNDNIRNFLVSKVRFYKERYFKSVYVAALSNPLIFICGTILYFYFKYHELRPLQLDDYLVLGIACITGFLLGLLSQTKQYDFQIGQMEACISYLDENGINEFILKKQARQRRIVFFIFILTMVAGLFVLGYFVFR